MTYKYSGAFISAVLISLFFTTPVISQTTTFWKGLGTNKPSLLRSEVENIATSSAYFMEINPAQLKDGMLRQGDFKITLPDPQGRPVEFELKPYQMMQRDLAEKFASIRTFKGVAIGNPNSQIYLTYSPAFFQVTVQQGDQTWYIDSYTWPARNVYQSYYKQDCREEANPVCTELNRKAPPLTVSLRENLGSIENVIRSYRLAVSVSYSYFQYYGKDLENTMAGIVATVNRVNMIYERDLGVRLILVNNNDQLIVTDPTDPIFTVSYQEDIENQEHIDDIIGNDNYDIGHIFNADGGGGYAELGVVCNDNIKAHGVTGLDRPQGDAFDIDFVAHEIGHQFGANHTFNGIDGSCGGTWYPFTAFEPGAGTTIMAYAGICGTDNITPGSDAYFHGGSIAEMNIFLLGNGNTCAQIDTTGNKAPRISTEIDQKTIPVLTPFELTATVTDEDPDSLLFAWEEVDRGAQLPLGNYGASNEPLFRSFAPGNSPKRTFPQLSTLLRNQYNKTELLPNSTRSLSFQMTVRDQSGAGPAIAWSRVKYFVDGEKGPFRIDNPAELIAGTNHKLEWQVNGTDVYPISADSVVLWLSTDGGQTFPIALDTFANTGVGVFFLPEGIQSNAARLKLKPLDNIFFDISDQDLTIQTLGADQTFVELIDANQDLIFCGSDSIQLFFYYNAFESGERVSPEILVNSGSFTNEVDTFANKSGGAIRLMGGADLPTGLYPVEVIIRTLSAADTLRLTVDLQGQDALLSVPILFPESAAIDIALQPQFVWSAVDPADEYQVEIATDSSFENTLYFSSLTTDTSFELSAYLTDTTRFYWRVQAFNTTCGSTGYSEIRSFTTEQIYCKEFRPGNLPIPFNALPFIQSNITITDASTVYDVNVKDIRGTFPNPNALSFKLRSPEGPIIDLLTRRENCEIGTSFYFSVDDEAESTYVPCPNDEGAVFVPVTLLRTFQGQRANGQWSLSIFDNGNEGELENWVLEVCYGVPANSIISTDEELFQMQSTVKVYPNPLQSVLYFLSEDQPIEEIRVVDMLGRVLLSQKNIQSVSYSIDVEQWSRGAYIYQLQTKDGRVQVGKVVR